MLEIKNLHASYKNMKILNGINLSVKKGEFHLILGLNGSGKSTLGKILLSNTRYTVTKGSIFYYNEEITNLPTFEIARKGIFLSHQSPPSLDGVSVKNLLRFVSKSTTKRQSLLKFSKLLNKNIESVGLNKDFIDRDFNVGASGGERKKIELLSLLTIDAKLAFLDEIDSGLDIDALKTVSNGINDFLSNSEKSVILVSHSESILKYLNPTHVHVFCGGRILQSGNVDLAKKIYTDGYEKFIDCSYCK
jgi:Fe-S cluster assembly ATP-binding protein